ncbi:MAG TPA: MDR family oxidoreductase [Thermoanaerobaculia bacterium]|nr:MDR family oxidoreductase [Thermoanaerobaculia bacterium]
MHDTFRALIARKSDDGYTVSIEELNQSDLPAGGEVLVEVACSSLNYKDGLAVTARGKIIRRFPMVLGIDLAGTVVSSASSEFQPGDRVLATGQGLGETDWGGYAGMQRVRADALVPIPAALSFQQGMAIGTAGLTAMLCVMALDHAGIRPDEREVVVTGAGGGVGSIAVMLLARRGYKVAASTGRAEIEPWLRGLGASSIVPREDLARKPSALESERWAGAVDTIGGLTLATLLAQTVYEGAVAACGMAGGAELSTTVFPLILRNVALLGVSSLRTPKETRLAAWSALAHELDLSVLDASCRIEPLSRIRELSEEILAGKTRGRVVIDVRG